MKESYDKSSDITAIERWMYIKSNIYIEQTRIFECYKEVKERIKAISGQDFIRTSFSSCDGKNYQCGDPEYIFRVINKKSLIKVAGVESDKLKNNWEGRLSDWENSLAYFKSLDTEYFIGEFEKMQG